MIRVVHKTKNVLGPLQECDLKRFPVNAGGETKWEFLPLVVSNCSDIPHGKDKSDTEHGVVKKRQCVRCMVTGDEIFKARMADDRLLRKTEMGRCNIINIYRCNIASVRNVNEVTQKRNDKAVRSC